MALSIGFFAVHAGIVTVFELSTAQVHWPIAFVAMDGVVFGHLSILNPSATLRVDRFSMVTAFIAATIASISMAGLVLDEYS